MSGKDAVREERVFMEAVVDAAALKNKQRDGITILTTKCRCCLPQNVLPLISATHWN